MPAIITAAESTTSNLEWVSVPNTGSTRMVFEGKRYEWPEEHPFTSASGESLTLRDPSHSLTMALLTCELVSWNRMQPEPSGQVLTGDAGFILPGQENLRVGIDVAYISAELAAQCFETTTLIEGVPLLVVEILSPSDDQESISKKIKQYLSANVPLIWVVDTAMQTISVYRPNARPYMVANDQEITGEEHLPGLHFPVAKIFS